MKSNLEQIAHLYMCSPWIKFLGNSLSWHQQEFDYKLGVWYWTTLWHLNWYFKVLVNMYLYCTQSIWTLFVSISCPLSVTCHCISNKSTTTKDISKVKKCYFVFLNWLHHQWNFQKMVFILKAIDVLSDILLWIGYCVIQLDATFIS